MTYLGRKLQIDAKLGDRLGVSLALDNMGEAYRRQGFIGAEDDGSDAEPFDIPELVRIVQQLLVAGNETTTKLLAEMIYLIAQTPGEWERLRNDPSRIPSSTEAGLRLSSPNQGMSRVVMRDTEIAGQAITKNINMPTFSRANDAALAPLTNVQQAIDQTSSTNDVAKT